MGSFEVESISSYDSFEEWDRFVDESPQGCIFCRSWWLEAVCPDGFEILTLKKGGSIVAGMPMPIYRRWGYDVVYMPKLTQTLGVLLTLPHSERYERRLSNEISVLEAFVAAIPRFGVFSMNFHCNFGNWLPFFWAGYKQTTRYTYVIPELRNLDKVFSDFAHSKRKNVSKAEQLVSVNTDLSAREFYANHVITLGKQGEQISYDFSHFERIYNAAYENGCGKIWYALDDRENIHAAIFVVFDSKSAYYLISTIDPDFRNSGAATLLVKHAIAHVSEYTERFDFEGSMIRGVENSFRKFGAIQTPYFNISKDNRSLPTRCLAAGKRELMNGIRRLRKLGHQD